MNQLQIFLPCAAGVEEYLQSEVLAITQVPPQAVHKQRGGVQVHGSWRAVLLLNLHCRLAQRVLVQLAHNPYRNEQDLYHAAFEVAWEIWFTTRQSIKVEVTAQHSPLTSLNFAALKIKDASAPAAARCCPGAVRWRRVRVRSPPPPRGNRRGGSHRR